jgi:hypothetical protein
MADEGGPAFEADSGVIDMDTEMGSVHAASHFAIGGREFNVAEPVSVTAEFYKKEFDATDLANINNTIATLMQRLEDTAETPYDAVTGRLLPSIPCQSGDFETQLLYQPRTFESMNKRTVTTPACKNGKLCASQYVKGFDGTPLMARMTEGEYILAIVTGELPHSPRECILCVRHRYTNHKMEHHLTQKSRHMATSAIPDEVQPFYNTCDPELPVTYKQEALLKVNDFPQSQRLAYQPLSHPIVMFEVRSLEWKELNGVKCIDQSALMLYKGKPVMREDWALIMSPPIHGDQLLETEQAVRVPVEKPSAPTQGESATEPRVANKGKAPAAESEEELPDAPTLLHPISAGTFTGTNINSQPFSFSGDFFVRGRASISEEHMPFVQLTRLCAPIYGRQTIDLCFARDFVKCAQESQILPEIHLGRDLGYNSWFVEGGHLENLTDSNIYVRLVVTRMLIAELLTKSTDPNLLFWLHLYIDQHIPFLTVAQTKLIVSDSDIIPPETVTPLSERTLNLSFLSLHAILSFKACSTQTEELTKIALKFMPNTGHYDKNLTWPSLSQKVQDQLHPILMCVFVGNFRHARFRPSIRQRQSIFSSSIESILALLQNDPVVLSRSIMECMTLLFEQQGFKESTNTACHLYMQHTVIDCDKLVRLAVAQRCSLTKTDVRFAGKTHKPAFPRERRETMPHKKLQDKVLLEAARSLYFRIDKKKLRLSLKHCIIARAKDTSFVQKLKLGEVSTKALSVCRRIIRKIRNQKSAFRTIADVLVDRFPADAAQICRIYRCLPQVQRAEIHPLDIETYKRQLAVCNANQAHRRHFRLCIICLTVDMASVSGLKETRFLTDLDKHGRTYCPNCVDNPCVVQISLLGVRLQLMDVSFALCVTCLEPEVVSTTKISREGFVVCSKCIARGKAFPIWYRPDKRRVKTITD